MRRVGKGWRPGRRVVVAALVLAAAAAAWVGSPRLLRRMRFFRVRQIELVGVRYLAPDAVIAALGLRPDANEFDDLGAPAARLRALPGVRAASISRRLPGALRVTVRETEPAALVAAAGNGALRVVDAAGRVLPYDPARSGVDLPVAASDDSVVTGVLALVRSLDPTLFAAITSARRLSRGGVALELDGGRRVLVGRDAGPDVIEAVVLVEQDLAARRRPYAELDARYAGQVVVRRKVSA